MKQANKSNSTVLRYFLWDANERKTLIFRWKKAVARSRNWAVIKSAGLSQRVGLQGHYHEQESNKIIDLWSFRGHIAPSYAHWTNSLFLNIPCLKSSLTSCGFAPTSNVMIRSAPWVIRTSKRRIWIVWWGGSGFYASLLSKPDLPAKQGQFHDQSLSQHCTSMAMEWRGFPALFPFGPKFSGIADMMWFNRKIAPQHGRQGCGNENG